MKLQAIIGKRNGNPNHNDVLNIINYLISQGEDIKGDSFDDCNELLMNNKIHINASNLTDHQSFYQYLSQNGYILIDSKLTQDCKLKQENKE